MGWETKDQIVKFELLTIRLPLATRWQNELRAEPHRVHASVKRRPRHEQKTEKGQFERLGSVVLPAAPFGVHSNLVALEIRMVPPQGPWDGRNTRT